jgi:hypothetical protein
MTEEKTLLILHASRQPNDKGEFNWYEFKSYPKIDLCLLQNLVHGRITLLPNMNPEKCKYLAYADEEGLLKEDFARNGMCSNFLFLFFCGGIFFCFFGEFFFFCLFLDLAGGALYQLGFRGSSTLGLAYAGTVVVLDENERGLNKEEQAELTKTIVQFRKMIEGDYTDDENQDKTEDC